MKDISIQLWSVNKKITEHGFEKCLHELSAMGYTGVEFAGHKDVKANEMKKFLSDSGLRAVGSHTGYGILTNSESLKEEMEYMAAVGAKYISCPHMTVESEDILKKRIEELSVCARTLKENGFVFSYHNHDFELTTTYGGKTALDIFYENTNPEEVYAEHDVYWLLHGGVDPYDYLTKFKNRIKILHLKQMLDLESKEASTANKGIIDFSRIMSIAKDMGCLEFVYEDETPSGDQMENARISTEAFK